MVAAALTITEEQKAELEQIARSSVLPHRSVVQAKALLWAGEGVSNEENARRCGVTSDAIRRWRNRFEDNGVAGVGKIAKGRGRKPWLPAGTTERVLEATRSDTPPGGATHWSTRSMAAHLGIGKDTVAQVWRDYKRNATIDLFAAMDIATGQVHTRPHRRGRAGLLQTAGQESRRAWTCTSSWTTCPRIRRPRSPNGLSIHAADVGTCTSPRPRAPGPTWSSGGHLLEAGGWIA
jgi:transposase